MMLDQVRCATSRLAATPSVPRYWGPAVHAMVCEPRGHAGRALPRCDFMLKSDGFCIINDEFCIKNDDFCITNNEGGKAKRLSDDHKPYTQFCIQNDELKIENDDSCIKNDEFCITNDEFCIINDELWKGSSRREESR